MCYSWERSIYTWHGPGEEQGWSELAAILWTLLGLVVSIPSFVFLTAFPIMKVMEEGKRSELKSNGKKIYVAAFADALEGTNQTVGFPLSKDYRTGSDYFRRLFGQRSPPVSSTNTPPLCGGDSRLYRCSMVGQSGVRKSMVRCGRLRSVDRSRRAVPYLLEPAAKFHQRLTGCADVFSS